jgi:hypothetical protein
MKADAIIEAISDELKRSAVFEHDGYLVIRLKKTIKPLLAGFRTPRGKLIEQRNNAILRYRRLVVSQRFYKSIAILKMRECVDLRLELKQLRDKLPPISQ